MSIVTIRGPWMQEVTSPVDRATIVSYHMTFCRLTSTVSTFLSEFSSAKKFEMTISHAKGNVIPEWTSPLDSLAEIKSCTAVQVILRTTRLSYGTCDFRLP